MKFRKDAAVMVGAGLVVAAAAFAGAQPRSAGPHAPEAAPVTATFVSSPDDKMPPGTPTEAAARELLRLLPRAEARLGQEPYEQARFGTSWADPDKNGCDGRQDALTRWMGHDPTKAPCMASGDISDPYTGRTLNVPEDIHLDHVVPLREAWRAGADRWSTDKRLAFANDPGNLIPTSGSANLSKADKPADQWLPPSQTYWCEYARVYVFTKSAYSLTVTRPEAHALGVALDTCAVSAMTTAP